MSDDSTAVGCCVNVTHDGIADLLAHLSATDADGVANEFEAAIARVAERLAWRVDIDPLLKHDFLLLTHAVERFRRRHGAFASSATERLFRHCFATYQQSRSMALSAANTFSDWGDVDGLTTYDEFCRLSRSQRLSVQATLIKRNAADMETVYEFVLSGLAESTARLLNIGDGVPLQASFLSRIIERMRDLDRGPHVVSIDVLPDIYGLQREVVRDVSNSTCTFAFHQMDACATWFVDGIFDCAAGSFMVDDCQDQPRLLRELQRIVRPGGAVCLSGHHLAVDTPADVFVHNFADLHHLSGHPVVFGDVRRMLAATRLQIQDSVELPHAWGAILMQHPDGPDDIQ